MKPSGHFKQSVWGDRGDTTLKMMIDDVDDNDDDDVQCHKV